MLKLKRAVTVCSCVSASLLLSRPISSAMALGSPPRKTRCECFLFVSARSSLAASLCWERNCEESLSTSMFRYLTSCGMMPVDVSPVPDVVALVGYSTPWTSHHCSIMLRTR
eukprot:TRINITY_DN13236_c0_g1_i1.p3 TRINITY_DN13236_c0_g1~~TRINITY_DN13236_c0_g1_i1.p3  ORF type:complete len:112 (+),score=0.41 TRINITY_DN13236_c0_g1_i1:1188-1523(+)